MTRSAWASLGAFVVAFLASSHHTLHMALVSIGIGGSSLLFGPGIRRAMLLVSLAMTALAAWWILRKKEKGATETAAVVASTAASLALIAWSVTTHGW